MLKYLIILLLCASPAWAAIVYDDGEIQSSELDPYVGAFPENSALVTCVAFVAMRQTLGPVSVFIVANDPDNAVWTLAATETSGDIVLEAWTAISVDDASANIWAYLTEDGDNSSIDAECYSGVLDIGINDTTTGSSTAPSIAIITQDSNNFVVTGMAFAGTATWAANVGTLRNSYDGGGVGQAAIAVVDNTNASATSITTSATLGSSKDWAAIAIELRTISGDPPITRRPFAAMMFQ